MRDFDKHFEDTKKQAKRMMWAGVLLYALAMVIGGAVALKACAIASDYVKTQQGK